MKVAVQGFAIREELSDDFEGTIHFLSDNGFHAYEMGLYVGEKDLRVSEEVDRCVAYFGKMPGCIWSVDEAHKKLAYVREQGLMVESCHLFFVTAYEKLLEDQVEALIDFAKKNAIRQYVVSYMLSTWEAADAIKTTLSKVSQRLEAEGIHLAYHNHDKEMVSVGDVTLLERLLDEVPTLALQPDIGWMEAGGGPVERILTNYADRIHSVHFKDLYLEGASSDGEIVCTAIGYGEVNSLVVKALLASMPLIESGLIIDQDNAKEDMLQDLILGQRYIIKEFLD